MDSATFSSDLYLSVVSITVGRRLWFSEGMFVHKVFILNRKLGHKNIGVEWGLECKAACLLVGRAFLFLRDYDSSSLEETTLPEIGKQPNQDFRNDLNFQSTVVGVLQEAHEVFLVTWCEDVNL